MKGRRSPKSFFWGKNQSVMEGVLLSALISSTAGCIEVLGATIRKQEFVMQESIIVYAPLKYSHSTTYKGSVKIIEEIDEFFYQKGAKKQIMGNQVDVEYNPLTEKVVPYFAGSDTVEKKRTKKRITTWTFDGANSRKSVAESFYTFDLETDKYKYKAEPISFEAIPEPLTIVGSMIAVCFGWKLKGEIGKKEGKEILGGQEGKKK